MLLLALLASAVGEPEDFICDCDFKDNLFLHMTRDIAQIFAKPTELRSAAYSPYM